MIKKILEMSLLKRMFAGYGIYLLIMLPLIYLVIKSVLSSVIFLIICVVIWIIIQNIFKIRRK